MQANANLHEAVSDKAAQFTNYVVCDPQESGEDGRWRKRERKRAELSSGRPRRSFFFVVTAPLPAWLTAAAADIATLLLPSFCFNFIVTGQSGSREYEQNLLYHVLLFFLFFQLVWVKRPSSVSRPRRTLASLHRPATVCVDVLNECVWAHIINLSFTRTIQFKVQPRYWKVKYLF